MAAQPSQSSPCEHPAKRPCAFADSPPAPEDAALSEEQLAHYRSEGFVVYRGLLDSDEIGAVRKNILKIIDDWYDEFERSGFEDVDWKSVVNRDPAVKSGELVTDNRYLTVRRLFRMALHDEFFKQLSVKHPKVYYVYCMST